MNSISKRSKALKLVFVVNHVAFFVSHRLPIALAAKRKGYEVEIITGQAGSETMEISAVEKLNEYGIKHNRTIFRSDSLNFFTEFIGFTQLFFRLAISKPDLVHCVTPKGILYGGIASRLLRIKSVVFAISGMGFFYTKDNYRSWIHNVFAYLYRKLIAFAYKQKNRVIIVQNADDRSVILESNIAKESEIYLIKGSGVDLNQYSNINIESKTKTILFPARILRNKGVYEFIEAVKILRETTNDWEYIIAGASDYKNPTSIDQEEIDLWQSQGLINWVGHVEDMVSLYKEASIVCLPSYREGMPKVLLEAASASCAIITTDVPGCRESIIEGVTGLLVPPRDSKSLAESLRIVMNNDELRRRFSNAGREYAVEHFSIDIVISKTLDIYDRLLHINHN